MSATHRARSLMADVAQQAEALAGACQRASEGTETQSDRETIADALETALRGAGLTAQLVAVAPVLMAWLYPQSQEIAQRHQRFLIEEQSRADNEQGEESA